VQERGSEGAKLLSALVSFSFPFSLVSFLLIVMLCTAVTGMLKGRFFFSV
jgi:hypothetical protein